jgi:hypothetical protein
MTTTEHRSAMYAGTHSDYLVIHRNPRSLTVVIFGMRHLFFLNSILIPDGATSRGRPWPPSLSIPCSVSQFVYIHLSQVHGHVIKPSRSWSSSSSCCIHLCSFLINKGKIYWLATIPLAYRQSLCFTKFVRCQFRYFLVHLSVCDEKWS